MRKDLNTPKLMGLFPGEMSASSSADKESFNFALKNGSGMLTNFCQQTAI